MKIKLYAQAFDSINKGLFTTIHASLSDMTKVRNGYFSCETDEEYDDAMDLINDGDHPALSNYDMTEVEVDLLDLIPSHPFATKDDAKPYLFELVTHYGGYEEREKILAYTKDPKVQARILAKEQRDSTEDDWDEDLGGFWFDGCMVKVKSWREITPAQAEIWSLAKSF